jgi:hypothetical protein
VADHPNVVVDGIETIGLHNGLYRIRFYMLDAKGQPTPAVELVAMAETWQQIQKALSQVKPAR